MKKAVHLRHGVGVACGAHESWFSRGRPLLDLSRTVVPADVTCRRCQKTYSGRVAAGAYR